MFRRAAFVGLQGKAGELTLGNRTNSLIVVHGTVMPLAGNSWDASIAAAFGFADFLTKNAITYTTPTMSGFRAQLQHGMSNTAGLDDQGSVNAGHARWDIGNLTLMAAFQDRNAGGTTSSANATATAAQGNVNTNVYGVQYKVTPKMIAAAAFVSNDVAGVKRENYQYGVRYELTPKTSIGGNYMTSDTEKNSLTNLQARYNLSKRTTLYTQYSVADNGATNPVQALNTNTGNSPAVNVSGLTRLANTKQTALGVGIIHSF
jgi:predicted porin